MQKQSLEGKWEFSKAGAEEWREASVPGDVYTDLLENGVIDDPHVNDNEFDMQWVGKSDWTYRRTVTVDESLASEDRICLVFEGLDTVATVEVGGTEVGMVNNAHRRYEFDVTEAVMTGDNEVAVTFHSPVEYGVDRHEEHPHEVPWMEYPIEQPARNFVRKPQYHYGWDWGPCLPTMGIWKSARIVGHSRPRITDVATSQDHSDEDVTLDVTVHVDAPEAGEYEVEASVEAATASETTVLDAGQNQIPLSLTVEEPALWWPHDLGEQPLSELTVSLGEDVHTERIGFREVEIVQEPDKKGESFAIAVNGHQHFAKGANWIPTEVLPGCQRAEQYEQLLTSAKAANMNVVRVWGGGQYEREQFYDLCDELGLLVWQDFMFACSAYPADDEYLTTVETEARQQVRRLSTHPSVAVWCGNNEVEMGLNTWFNGEENLDQLCADYRELFHDLLPMVVEEEHPARPYWPSSPSSGIEAAFDDDGMPTGEALSFDTGTMHDWRVWHSGEPFEAYEDVIARFDAEFGYQSFASSETLSTALDDDQMNPTAPLMEHHQRSEGGNERIVQRMADYFRIPFDFDSFVFISQIQQVLAMEVGIEHWRRERPLCMGTIFWQLNDVWPCASWSSIEYGGRWKVLQYAARRFFAPVLVSTTETDGGLAVWVTNDERDGVQGTLTVESTTFDGETVFEHTKSVAVDGADSQKIETLAVEDLTGAYERSEVLVRVEYNCDAESYANYELLDRYKRLDLPEPELVIAVENDLVTVSAEHAGLFVTLETKADGVFSDNCFHLAAGEERTVTFDGNLDDVALAEDISVTHLRDTY